MNERQNAEPWLRGIGSDIDPVIGHLLRSSQQVRDEIAGITFCEFHLRHLAGSTDRLCTYLEGRQLSAEQLDTLAREHEPCTSAEEWIAAVNRALDRYDGIIRRLTPAQFSEVRQVGRQRLTVTAVGLAIHIAEHAQRHTGQALTSQRLRKF